MIRYLSIALLCLNTLLVACGGGGGSTSQTAGSSSASSSGGQNSGAEYSISLNKPSIAVHNYFDGSILGEQVSVSFVGDGLLVEARSIEADQYLSVEVLSQTNSTAELLIAPSGLRLYPAREQNFVLRMITGSSNTGEMVYKDLVVVFKQHDGLRIPDHGFTFYGVWGEANRHIDGSFVIDTISSAWSLSSDSPAIQFSQTSGQASRTIEIDIDFNQLEVGNSDSLIQVESDINGIQTIPVSFEVTSPLVTPPFDLELSFVNAPGKTDLEAREFWWSIDTDISVDVPWSIEGPKWLVGEGLSGTFSGSSNTVDLSLIPENIEFAEGLDNTQIVVSIDIPGAVQEFAYPVSLEQRGVRIQSSRGAFAFSDYATNEDHAGGFNVTATNGISIEELRVNSEQEWIEIDSVVGDRVNFSLNTSALPSGLSVGKITISPISPSALNTDSVTVGYYKSDQAITEGPLIELDFVPVDVEMDRFAPRMYVADISSIRIAVINLHTNEIERFLEAPAGIENWIESTTISNDGTILYAYNRHETKLYRFDLLNQEYIDTTVVPLADSPNVDEIRFVKTNGKEMINRISQFLDLDTYEFVYVDQNFYTGIDVKHDFLDSGIYYFTSDSTRGLSFNHVRNEILIREEENSGYTHNSVSHIAVSPNQNKALKMRLGSLFLSELDAYQEHEEVFISNDANEHMIVDIAVADTGEIYRIREYWDLALWRVLEIFTPTDGWQEIVNNRNQEAALYFLSMSSDNKILIYKEKDIFQRRINGS